MGSNETIPVPADRPWGFAHDLLRLRTSGARQFIDRLLSGEDEKPQEDF